ncbi:class I SAM-dependent methyltransferase [Oceanicella actignis]|uniref:Methyltransferase domain-containing protein n=1 Tax=Oceanicella actignis TaxID=1189325 RepID=A0A1M7RX34_9RHOB|nr:class I SAM-dependent methyltransferase [Oceanicella actignis]SES99383.1 Methyltransferase domain-containing protein [Oceanicella actignis]SHN50694.1 Methyltransferase domain-containing protein [Oceanicella actignis]
MDPVQEQYELLPYPARDPADEDRRLIVGSPSELVEVDHFLFRGGRDWSQPFRALVAGGGTGDGLILLAQRLRDAGCPARIVYLDLSRAAREVAEARAARRGLSDMIRFETGDIARAPELAAEEGGAFDYVDCCGVLHHLPDPEAGLTALARALAPEGGMGLMLYAPYGRTGVYPLQEAFAQLLGQDPPAEKLRLARAALGALPPTNWFLRNEHLRDHETGDTGFYDLLLHGRDRPYDVPALLALLEAAGLAPVSFVEPARYDPRHYLPEGEEFAARVARLSEPERWALAERLAGNMRAHVLYVAPRERAEARVARPAPDMTPHLNALRADALAREIHKRGRLRVNFSGVRIELPIPREAAPIAARLDGRLTLGRVAQALGLDWLAFGQRYAPLHRALTSANLLRLSRGLK